ncbi:MAG: PaaI family thioesterase [Rhizobiaceae bacterium]
MTDLFETGISDWLCAVPTSEESVYRTTFAERHLGNIWIRSLHGGVTGSMIELSAEAETRKALARDANLVITSSSVDYLRITKDTDLYSRTKIQRLSRRLSIVDVTCWQDDEDTFVARGIVTIKIEADQSL